MRRCYRDGAEAAPIQRAIQAGHKESGVTIMQMDVGLHTGPMLLERVTPIDARETGASLHDRLSTLGAEAVLEAIDAIAAGQPQPLEQPRKAQRTPRKSIRKKR